MSNRETAPQTAREAESPFLDEESFLSQQRPTRAPLELESPFLEAFTHSDEVTAPDSPYTLDGEEKAQDAWPAADVTTAAADEYAGQLTHGADSEEGREEAWPAEFLAGETAVGAVPFRDLYDEGYAEFGESDETDWEGGLTEQERALATASGEGLAASPADRWSTRSSQDRESPFRDAYEEETAETSLQIVEAEAVWDVGEQELEEFHAAMDREGWLEPAPDGTALLSGERETESTAKPPGVSAIAVQDIKQWPARLNRPSRWQGQVYGLVVHSTGAGAPGKAQREGLSPAAWAVSHYKKSRGTHYVNGWGGMEAGELIQVANEIVRAKGVGFINDNPKKNQRRSITAGRFDDDLPGVLVRLWHQRWPGKRHSLELLPPGANSANVCYVHVESPPCVFWWDDKRGTGPAPMRPGLRFTKAQHDAIAHLAVDVARRNGWPMDETWWRTPRLLGHEDLTPISRHNSGGGWDPGYLRQTPTFDWDYVYGEIQAIARRGPLGTTLDAIKRSVDSVFTVLGALASRFRELVAAGQEHQAITLAYQQGQTDANKLTNLVFFARHPKLGGRAIRRDEKGLAGEWVRIRDELVRPFLNAEPSDEVLADELEESAHIDEAEDEQSNEIEKAVQEFHHLDPGSDEDAFVEAAGHLS